MPVFKYKVTPEQRGSEYIEVSFCSYRSEGWVTLDFAHFENQHNKRHNIFSNIDKENAKELVRQLAREISKLDDTKDFEEEIEKMIEI